MKRTLNIGYICALLVWTALAQTFPPTGNDTLALVGSVPVRAMELRQRLELMPWPGKERASKNDSIRIHALQGLVAERILAFESARLGLTEDAVTRRMRHGLENVFLRDELYRTEITEKSRPDENAIAAGLKRFAKQLTVQTFLVSDERRGETLARALRRSRSVDSVLRVLPSDAVTSIDTITVNFGGLDPSYEDAAYALKPNGISPPMNSPVLGWVVLKLFRTETNPEAAKKSVADRYHHVQKVLQSRNEGVRAPQFFYGFLAGKNVQADSVLLWRVTSEVLKIWERDTAAVMNNGSYSVGPGMIDEVIAHLQDVGDSPYVQLADGPFLFADAVEMLRYHTVQVKTRDAFSVAVAINGTMREIVAGEILAREARRRTLQYAPRVERDLQMWTSFWAARALFYSVRDSVAISDADVESFLLKNAQTIGNAYEVNVQEVLVGDLTGVDSVFSALQANRSFGEVARAMSLRSEWRLRDGESGFFAVAERPELGFKALDAKLNNLQGPLRLKEGYSVFRVLGVRKKMPAVVGFDTLKANVQGRLLATKRQERVDSFLAEQAKQYRVQFFYDRLNKVPITDSNMFTRRTIGFGGSMLAVPMLLQQWEWVKKYENEIPAIP